MSESALAWRVQQALARCGADADAESLCQATVGALAAGGHVLASVYLARGDRLRCMAVSGYGQLYDGIPPGEGVIGQAFSLGRTVYARADDARGGYRPAAEGVQEEISVALLHNGQCLGVLNVETTAAFSAETIAGLRQAGQLLAAAVGASGGAPAESTAQRLVRHATVLAGTDDLPSLAQALLAAALDLTGHDTACLLGPGGCLAAAGPGAGALRDLPGDVVVAALRWVEQGGSSRTSGDPAARPGPAQAGLAQAGLRSFVLVPLASRGELLGGLVVGHSGHDQAEPSTVEALELLAALAAADLRSLRAADVLRRQARTDHLTGLPHRRAFAEALDQALALPSGTDLGVLLIDLDDFKTINDTHGHQTGDEVLTRTARVLRAALRDTDALYRIGGDEFAALIDARDEHELVAVADRILWAARRAGVTVSAGGAHANKLTTHSHHRPLHGEDLVRTADQRMYQANRDGRDRAHVPRPRAQPPP